MFIISRTIIMMKITLVTMMLATTERAALVGMMMTTTMTTATNARIRVNAAEALTATRYVRRTLSSTNRLCSWITATTFPRNERSSSVNSGCARTAGTALGKSFASSSRMRRR